MKSIVIKTPEAATKLLPKTGYMSIRFKQQGNGSEYLEFISVGNQKLKISGGVFIDDQGAEVTEILPSGWGGTTKVKVKEKYAYVYFPNDPAKWVLRFGGLQSTPNKPSLDGNSRINQMVSFALMFAGNSFFNSPIYGIETTAEARAGGCTEMLRDCSEFDQEIEHLDTTGMTSFTGMLFNNYKFNKPLAKLDVASAVAMNYMLKNTANLNQSLKGWKTAKVLDFSEFLMGSSNYNQDLSVLDFNVDVLLSNFISWTAISPENYDKLLEKLASYDWTARTTPKVFDAQGVRYTSKGAVFRNKLITAGWTITDAGQAS
ncbi:BspA family leucine-rich repeat surface protein [Elizabethkingia anophelis]|uniref:BspA family leucine-rich repeat surface protein n=1 Tax=Elizabethkingia anophelis TaxID=1117645 RepID=UPI00320838FF